jgi:LysR family transcriptional regulator, hydrogen peroxide-inducible genes activator
VAEELNFTCASDREGKSTHLTDLARMVRPHLQSVYDHSMQAKRLSQDPMRKVPVKLNIMSTISPDGIVDLIGSIRTHHPDVELKLCDSNANDLFGWRS